MTWLRLEDGFATHPKVLALSDRAFRAHVLGLCYCSQHLTDGFVPTGYVPDRAATELTKAGLWEPSVGVDGFQIHDFLAYNPSRASVLADREAARQRMAEVRANRNRTTTERSPEPTGNFEESSSSPTRPDPDPTPVSKAPPTAGNPVNPVTHDQLYLAERILDSAGKHLKPPAIQKLNMRFGTEAVTGALRRLHGFPPPEPIGSVYAYVESLCQMEATG